MNSELPGMPSIKPLKRLFFWVLARVLVIYERISPAGKGVDLD